MPCERFCLSDLQDQDKIKALEIELSETAQKVRQSQDANDALSFNNARLSKSIASLQEQIQILVRLTDQKKKSGGGLSLFGSSKAELVHKEEEMLLLREELQNKLSENESLVHQLYDLKQEQEQTLSMLQTYLALT
jgi:hypothetical protein